MFLENHGLVFPQSDVIVTPCECHTPFVWFDLTEGENITIDVFGVSWFFWFNCGQSA